MPDSFTITVASAQVPSTLTDFPVAVDLSNMPASFWSGVDEDGETIAVFNASSTRLPVDVVRLDHGAQTGWIVFLADSLSASSDTDFTLDFTGSGEAAFDRDDVWADFVGVWLLGESPHDRTGGGQHLTSAGDPDYFELIETAPISNVHEGVTTDGTHYYGFDSSALRKFDDTWTEVATNTSIGSGSGNPGIDALGGGVHHDGKLYVAADASGTQYLSVWDASDLSFIEAFNIDSFADGAADFTYNPADGLLYTISFSGGGTANTLIKIDPADGSDQGTLSLSTGIGGGPNGIVLWRDAYWVTSLNQEEVYRVELDGTVRTGGLFGLVDNGLGVSIDGDGIWAVNNDTPRLWKPYDIDLGLGGGAHTDGDASNIRLYTQLNAAHGTVFTLGASLTVEDTADFHSVIVTEATLGATNSRAMISTTNGGVWQQYDENNGPMSGTSAVSIDTPYRSHVVWNGTTSKTSYVNGSQDAQEAGITAIGGSNDVVAIADNNDDPIGGGGAHQGLLGFLYIRDEALSADWISAEYSMLNDNATFLSISGPLSPNDLQVSTQIDAASVEVVPLEPDDLQVDTSTTATTVSLTPHDVRVGTFVDSISFRRPVDSGAQDELDKATGVAVAHVLEIHYEQAGTDKVLRLTTASRDLDVTVEGSEQTFSATPTNVLRIGTVEVSSDMAAQGVELTLGGVDRTFIALVMADDVHFRGRLVKMWRVYLDPDAGTVSAVVPSSENGWLFHINDRITFEENWGGRGEPGTVTVKTRIVSRLAVLQQPTPVKPTVESHNEMLSRAGVLTDGGTRDTMFKNVAGLMGRRFRWGENYEHLD